MTWRKTDDTVRTFLSVLPETLAITGAIIAVATLVALIFWRWGGEP